MSHIEIAKLAGKRPDTVKKSMERLQDKGLITFTPMTEKSTGGRPSTSFHVNQRDSYVVMAQVSPEFTAKLVDRWQELENRVQQQTQPAIPTSTGNPVLDALIQTLV
ncbi:Rha family transcriptional regulator, partial [Endozoicomonas sp. ONNA1]|uniref:Rha family transcriptional regulator n=1 Tax=Endozoicomonas sp. ONNA1 TaxID=2828740 RepID=UPI002147D84A